MLTNEEKNILLNLAKKSLEQKSVEHMNIFSSLQEKKATFVSLYKDNELRWCIWHIVPVTRLWESVYENAYNAGYKDPRFPPLDSEEIKNLIIEISVLTNPAPIEVKNPAKLLENIDSSMWLILQKWNNSGTFLPQVWEKIPNKEEFMKNLSMKAGLHPEAWKDADTEIYYYKVESFQDKTSNI